MRISTTLKMISMILTMPAIKKLPRLLIQLLSERSYVSLNPEKKEAPAETPEETSEHSEESEKSSG